MTYIPSPQLLRILRSTLGQAKSRPHIQCLHRGSSKLDRRVLQTNSTASPPPKDAPISLRKQLKDEAKARKLGGAAKLDAAETKLSKRKDNRLDTWELTVGIEIHAELNTAHKLFSPAQTSLNDTPNTHVSVFDAALPGSQPQFQVETLLPALRAALALDCEIQRRSTWDRKHYFWWDQPNGYQITQYYHPFAKSGSLTLYTHDDIDPADHPSITIGIKQVQMEQDTAKTVLQPPATHLLDFNRVSHPLIEIITLPQIHHPKTAAALVRKIQSILKAVNASTTGMEMGGLRADVNVSVRQRHMEADADDMVGFEYGGVKGLGQRTEIKNLSSFKAVEDAIVAERDRQISVLEAGGVIEGETRGWTLGSSETRRLRGKEGEVDYRYMPDPDLGAVIIGEDLLENLKSTLPSLPDETLALLTQDPAYSLTTKDAKTLLSLDDGERVEYYLDIVHQIRAELSEEDPAWQKAGKLVANWLLHHLPTELPPSFTTAVQPLSSLLLHLLRSQITLPTAKALLPRLLADPTISIPSTLDAENLLLQPMTEDEYVELARKVVAGNEGMAGKARAEAEMMVAAQTQTQAVAGGGNKGSEVGKGGKGGGGAGSGKIMWFVGQMVRMGEEGRVQPERAEGAVRLALGLP